MKITNTARPVEYARKTTIFIVLTGCVALIILTMINGYPNIWRDFEKEKNAWTFGNSLLMFLTAVVAYVSYFAVRFNSREDRRDGWIWIFLSLVFLYMSADDFLLLHERGGHAVENLLPLLSRENIIIYMDDIFELGYVVFGVIFGILFLRKSMKAKNSFKFYMLGAAFLFIATFTGLNPAVKSSPVPLALIQLLQFAAAYTIFTAFLNNLAAELIPVKEE